MIELLNKHEKAAKVIRDHYLEIMLGGLDDSRLPDNFKDYVRAKGIDNNRVVEIVEGSPRNLFDVFDKHSLFVETMYMERAFHYTISNGTDIITSNTKNYSTRKECDRAAVEEALVLLDGQLNN